MSKQTYVLSVSEHIHATFEVVVDEQADPPIQLRMLDQQTGMDVGSSIVNVNGATPLDKEKVEMLVRACIALLLSKATQTLEERRVEASNTAQYIPTQKAGQA